MQESSRCFQLICPVVAHDLHGVSSGFVNLSLPHFTWPFLYSFYKFFQCVWLCVSNIKTERDNPSARIKTSNKQIMLWNGYACQYQDRQKTDNSSRRTEGLVTESDTFFTFLA